MVTQGQGLSKRDFDKILAGARLVAEHTNLKRCASIGHMSVARAQALKDAGIQRVHHNVETAESYYPEVSTTVRYQGRIRTIEAVREAGLETCVGGILNLGETREQRVEMAFELAAINPTSVPINLLNPRPGTKFGDRELMDPWEVVKWIAIFRLILPEALFRLCGGRVENLGELQATAVRAGLNGVMMGNFLTTLGNTPEQDQQMFSDAGLNIGRQDDNGANPRPDNRSGWLQGETPDVIEELLAEGPSADTGPHAPSGDAEHARREARPARARPARPDGLGRARCGARSDRPAGAPLGSLLAAALPREAQRAAAPRWRAEQVACGRHGRAGPRAPDSHRRDRARGPVNEIEQRLQELERARAAAQPADGQRAAGSACAARRQAGPAAVLEQLSRASPTIRACARRRPRPRCAGAWAPEPRG